MVNIKYEIQNIIRTRRLAWFGHVCRLPNDSLEKRSLEKIFKKEKRKG